VSERWVSVWRRSVVRVESWARDCRGSGEGRGRRVRSVGRERMSRREGSSVEEVLRGDSKG